MSLDLKTIKYKGLFTKMYNSGNVDCVKSRVFERNGKNVYELTIKFADYTSIDNSRDKLQKGCFDNSIRKNSETNRKIALLWQHDKRDPIGKITEFFEKDDGMYCKVELSDFDSVPNAKRTWAQVVDGTLNQASFGYRYIWDNVKFIDAEDPENHDRVGYWLVGEVELWEVSIVTFGDNENTSIESVNDMAQVKASLTTLFSKSGVKEAITKIEDTELKAYLRELGIIENNKPAEERKSLFGRK